MWFPSHITNRWYHFHCANYSIVIIVYSDIHKRNKRAARMYAKTFFSVPPLMVHGLLVRKSKMRNCLRKFKSTRIHGFEGKRWCMCILILVVIGQAYGLFYAFARIFIYERIPEKYVIDTRWNIGTCFKLTISVTP